MPYTINKFNNEPLVVLEDGTIDTSTSIGLVGRNYVGYGETQNENFVWMLENFANEFPPSRPLKGQTWFNNSINILHVYDGDKWTIVGSAVLDDTPPDAPSDGSLWLKTPANTLHIWADGNWRFIGPETAEGFGITRAVSTTILDSDNVSRPIIKLMVNDGVIGIISATAFLINPSNTIVGFNNLSAGLNLSSSTVVRGNLLGNSATTTRLLTARTINGVLFDGTQNITISSSTTNTLKKGTYLTGDNFNGSTETTWAVDASSANQAGKVVARNSSGGFSAGVISADLMGNVTAASGTSTFDIVQANTFIGATLSGNAATATKLATVRKINGVNFDGSSDITVTAASVTLTGTQLSPSVRVSQLTQVGTLDDLSIADPGVTVGGAGEISLEVQGGTPTLSANLETGMLLKIFDQDVTGDYSDIGFITSAQSLSSSGVNQPAFAPNYIHAGDPINLGTPNNVWDKIYANTLVGNADTATLAAASTNLAGGGAGSLPYQTASGTTSFLPAGTPGYVLRATAGNSITWSALALERLTAGYGISYTGTGSPSYYDTQLPLTISVDATSANTVSKVVARDASGNFSAGTITASLVGSVTGNATSASQLQTARTINGVSFNGTANITIDANDPTKVAIAGSTMTGYLTLNGNPTSALHAAPKQYVDSRLPQFSFTYGNTVYSTSGYTNQVGSWNNGANFFDVFPPSGKTMANLVAFIPSIAVIHYAGGVDGNDSLRCTWSDLGDRIRVYVQNTEQRSTPAASYLAIWS
jgi:hypothetical protein